MEWGIHFRTLERRERHRGYFSGLQLGAGTALFTSRRRYGVHCDPLTLVLQSGCRLEQRFTEPNTQVLVGYEGRLPARGATFEEAAPRTEYDASRNSIWTLEDFARENVVWANNAPIVCERVKNALLFYRMERVHRHKQALQVIALTQKAWGPTVYDPLVT